MSYTVLTWDAAPPDSPLRGLLVTFERGKTRTDVVFQCNHRVILDPPGEVHESLAQFVFDDGVASLTKTQVTKIRSILNGLQRPAV